MKGPQSKPPSRNPFTGAVSSYNTVLTGLLEKHGLYSGRMIASSKSRYVQHHPGHRVLFNACIFDEKAKQVFWGDVDLTVDAKKLQLVADEYGRPFFLTTEVHRMDFADKPMTAARLESKRNLEFNPTVKFSPTNRRRQGGPAR